MLVKDVIIKACDFIDNAELSNALKSNSSTLTSEMQETLTKLVKCFNLVRNEIASEYIPIVKEEVVLPKQNKIKFNVLSSTLIEIIFIKDKFGNKISYKLNDDGIYLDNSDEVTIKYNSVPNDLTEVGEFSSTLPERVYAYGVVKEYYFLQTLYEDAEIWDERFKSSLQILERKKSETIIPRRRWI